MIQQFALGFGYWWNGWCWLWRSRALGFYAVLPLLLATTFFVAVLVMVSTHLSVWTEHFSKAIVPMREAWAGFFYYPLWAVFFLFAFISLIYLTYLVHVALCGPFYSLLAERTLHDLGKSDRRMFLSFRVLWASTLKAFLFLLIGAGLFLFSFVPVVGIFGLLAALMILAFDTMDYSFEAMELGLRDRFRYFFRHLAQWLGMAASLALTLAIPGLTFLILPGAVVGAALILDEGDLRGSRTSP